MRNVSNRGATNRSQARGGAPLFVSLDHCGAVIIERGLVKPEDKAAAKRNGMEDAGLFTSAKKDTPVHGEKLCR